MNVKISKRLERVASFLPKGAIFADIGSDHAYLPCYVCQKDSTAVAIAGEVNKGPYQRAVETVQAYSLQGQVEVRLGNGLEILEPNEVQQVVIAGMGGTLIRDILDRGQDKLCTTNQIIAQPNVDARTVRKWLVTHGFIITDEDIIEENGHCYEIINTKRLRISAKQHIMDEKSLLFGPLLLRKKPPAFYKKWEQEAKKLERILEQINQSTKVDQKKQELFLQEWKWMKEVTKDEK